MGGKRYCVSGFLISGILMGCNSSPEVPPGTGARECVQAYYEALIQKDWPRAYTALDSESQKQCSSQQFGRLAQSYRAQLGFEPTAVLVRECEKHDSDATAHVILTGQSAAKEHRYKDAITLRRSDKDWRVALPKDFGRAKKR